MPVPDPPFLTPRILKVLEPSAGQYEVVVRMDPTVASKFPDEPFGTAIDAIGLAKKDSGKYPGYTLVSIEPADKGAKDHLWVFQKLSGPGWTTKSKSKDNLTPAKFRGQVTVVKTDQEVDPGTEPTALTGNLVSSVIQQVPNTGKAVRTEITETIVANPPPFLGQEAYEQRQVVNTSEVTVVESTVVNGLPVRTPADTGLLIVSSTVTPRGDGKSTKHTVSVGSWSIHTGSRWDENLNASVLFTEQFVAPTTGLSSPHTDVSIVNKDRSLKRTEVIPTAALKSYYSVIPARVDLGDLPRELLSVNVVWTSQYSIGTQDFAFFKTTTGKSWSLEGSHTDSANSSASIMPEVQFKFRDVSSSNLPGSLHEFYVSVPVTEAKILSRLGAVRWPTFKPESTTLTASGQSIRVSVSASASLSGTVSNNVVVESGWSKGTSDDVGGGLSHSSIQIPVCIHGAIALTGGTAMSQVVSATALIGISHSAVGSVSSTMTKSGTALGAVSPQTLPATGTVTAIPTKGLYLINAQIARPKWGFCLVSALVFNAKNLK